MIIYQIQQALSAIDEREKDIRLAERRLGEEIQRKLGRYTALPLSGSGATGTNPYKALLDYKTEDAASFYGRSTAVAALYERLSRRRLTILHSASGSGKTSLLQAGLTARLLEKEYFALRVRPYKQPPGLAIRRAFLPDLETQEELARFRPDRMTLRGFLEVVTRTLGGNRLYLFLDQFEEFFTELHPEQQEAFAKELLDCVESDLPVWWVLALSKEYFSDLHVFSDVRPFENEYFLPAFSLDEAREVICEPARRQGVTFEAGVVERILVDLRNADGFVMPPEVQLVCHTLFAERTGGTITLSLYEKARGRTGAPGAAGILTDHLARVVQRDLPPEQRPLANRVLQALVTSDKRRKVIGHDKLLAEFSPDLARPVDDILGMLAGNRLLRVDSDDAAGVIYELAHDYLLAEIVIDPETKSVKEATELLARGVEDYKRHQALLSKDRFDIIDKQRARLVLDADSTALLDLSRAHLEAIRRRQQRIIGGGILVFLALTLLASWQTIRSSTLAGQVTQSEATAESAFAVTEAERKRADAEAAEARARELMTQAGALDDAGADDNILVSSLLSIEAGRQANTPEVISTISGVVSDMAIPLLILPHDDWVNGSAWNGDESRLLSWSDDGTAAIWDAQSGERLLTFDHGRPVIGAVWSSDESRLLTWGNESVFVWDALTAEPLHQLPHEETIRGVAWNPDDSRILTWNDAKFAGGSPAAVWDAMTGERLYALVDVLDVPDGGLLGAAWSGDGRHILTWGDNTAQLWDANTGQQMRLFGHNQGLQLSGATWSADSQHVLTWSKDASAILWSLADAARSIHLEHNDAVLGAVTSQDGSRILTWSDDDKAAVWNAANGERLFTLEPEDSLDQASWSADESRILTWGHNDDTVYLWDAANGQSLSRVEALEVSGATTDAAHERVLTWGGSTAAIWNRLNGDLILRLEHDYPIYSAVWNADESRILTHSSDKVVIVWDALTGERLPPLEYLNGMVNGAQWSANGGNILAWYHDGTAIVWNTATSERLQTMEPEFEIAGATWNGDGSRILAWDGDAFSEGSAVITLDPVSGERLLTLDHDLVIGAAWSRDGNRLLTWGTDDTAIVWDALTGERLLDLALASNVLSAHWNADGTRILTGSSGPTFQKGEAIIWDATTGDRLTTFHHDTGVGGAVWSADESKILTWRDPGYTSERSDIVEVWDVLSKKRLQTLTNDAPVTGARWNADGSRVLAWSRDGATVIWDVASGERLLVLPIDGYPAGAAYNGDESHILTWSESNVVVWDAATGQRVQTLPEALLIAAAAWNPDESQIMVAKDNRILRYPTEIGELLTTACERVSRNLTWAEWRLYLPGQAYRCSCANLPLHPSVLAAPDAVIDENTTCAPEE